MNAAAVRMRAAELGSRRDDAEAELEAVRVETVELVEQAREADVPLTELADLVGVSQPGLYRMIEARSSRRAS